MKVIAIIVGLSLIVTGSVLGQHPDTTGRPAVERLVDNQNRQNEIRIDQNTKIISLLTIGITSLASVCLALFTFLIRGHKQTVKTMVANAQTLVKLNTDSTTAMVKLDSTIDKLAASIDNSGRNMASAVDRNTSLLDKVHDIMITTISNLRK